MVLAHNLGFPRIGAHRELKRALEDYWRGTLDRAGLEAAGRALRADRWQRQAAAGLDLLPTGDFSFYDHVLDMSTLLGAVPERFGVRDGEVDLDTYFRMARGRAPNGPDIAACEMTKWFDTNYHYIVPELAAGQEFHIASSRLFEEVAEARALGHAVKPVLLGPLTYLWLGKAKGAPFDRLDLLERLLPVYRQILERLRAQGVEWVQIDEPILVLDLPQAWRNAFEAAYHDLQISGLKRLLATYFGALDDNLGLACTLPVDGLHVDLACAPAQLPALLDRLPPYKVLSAGVVDGRNIWRADLERALELLEPARTRLGERLWIAPSCSLLHVPVDLENEDGLDAELRSWIAFATQKLDEIAILRQALARGRESVAAQLAAARTARNARARSPRLNRPEVRTRCASLTPAMARRASPYPARAAAQHARLQLPLLPTTTIGSFPQTPAIRAARAGLRAGRIGPAEYEAAMRAEIAHAIRRQEELGLDVLVHGEAERNDMVEYFGEQLEGFAVTRHGWVQSYGSRCVKPPLIYGDVVRPRPMTLDWIGYAQSLTSRPVKGMLTGPATMLKWSFVRDDQTLAETCAQIALALRDELADLERAGIAIIQVDEPALREGLPLRAREHRGYLDWTVHAFRLATSGVRDDTQVHTHMCYAEFGDILEAIAALDADVITLEAARSQMELLDDFARFRYPNEIGPGVYDIHSPRVPEIGEMMTLLRRASADIPAERLWINPDCGLKTRGWPETETALANMVAAARRLRVDVSA